MCVTNKKRALPRKKGQREARIIYCILAMPVTMSRVVSCICICIFGIPPSHPGVCHSLFAVASSFSRSYIRSQSLASGILCCPPGWVSSFAFSSAVAPSPYLWLTPLLLPLPQPLPLAPTLFPLLDESFRPVAWTASVVKLALMCSRL